MAAFTDQRRGPRRHPGLRRPLQRRVADREERPSQPSPDACGLAGGDLQARRVRQSIVQVAGCGTDIRSEEHTSELQSRQYLVCRLLLEKNKDIDNLYYNTTI